MLNDTVEIDKEEIVTAHLQNQGNPTLYYTVATHPHRDYTGGMDNLLNNFHISI